MQVWVVWRRATAGRGHWSRGRMRRAVRYRLRRARLPHDWWAQFERDFAAYVDPGAVRARDRERS
jgi:hypothetical protein